MPAWDGFVARFPRNRRGVDAHELLNKRGYIFRGVDAFFSLRRAGRRRPEPAAGWNRRQCRDRQDPVGSGRQNAGTTVAGESQGQAIEIEFGANPSARLPGRSYHEERSYSRIRYRVSSHHDFDYFVLISGFTSTNLRRRGKLCLNGYPRAI